MDISPLGGSALDELKLAEQTIAANPPADPFTAVGSFTDDCASNLTFLSTLAKLQQALQQVTADKLSSRNSPKAVPSSVLSLLATLPSLICKLKSAGESQTTSTLCPSQPLDQQHITVQGLCTYVGYV